MRKGRGDLFLSFDFQRKNWQMSFGECIMGLKRPNSQKNKKENRKMQKTEAQTSPKFVQTTIFER